MREKLKRDTRVLVHSKTHGCPMKSVMKRKNKMYPKQLPFYAWIKREDSYDIRYNIYTLYYRKGSTGGDYYKRSDFEIVDESFLKEDDFLV